MKPPIIVFDTNCYYAAAFNPAGYMHRWLEIAMDNQFSLYSSPEILAELQSKLENKLGYSPKQSVEFRNFIEAIATVVYPTVRLNIVRDTDDNKILECAVHSRATAIISFDKDLLNLKEFKQIKIIHPRMLKYWFIST